MSLSLKVASYCGMLLMKKTALILALISALLFSVVVTQFTSLVNGNFNPFGGLISPLPGTSPPKITILSPENHSSCMVSEVNFDVDISMPETTYSAEFDPLIVTGLLDDEYLADLVVIESLLYNLGGGTHKLEVRAECVVHPSDSTWFESTSTSTVYFTIENTQSPSSEPESLPTTLVAAASIIVVVFAVFLLMRKHKQ
jgi:hypothetical protein